MQPVSLNKLPHSIAVIGAPAEGNGGGGSPSSLRPGVHALRNTLLALLAVVAVMTAHAIVKLLLLPFRALRGLFPAQDPASSRDGALTRSRHPTRTPVR